MRGLGGMGHFDDLAAEPGRLQPQCTGFGLPGGGPNCKVHRQSPVTRAKSARSSGLVLVLDR